MYLAMSLIARLQGTWKFPCTSVQRSLWQGTWKFPCTLPEVSLQGTYTEISMCNETLQGAWKAISLVARYMEISMYLVARYIEISVYFAISLFARYMEISMYLVMCFTARYMEISMYLVMCFTARYMETHNKVHGNFHVPCLMFGKRKKNLTEVTSITDKFANRFQNWLNLKNSSCLMPKENCLLHPSDQKRTFRLTFYHVCSLPCRKLLF